MHTESFSFDYQPGAIHYGRGQAEQLEAILTDAGYERALVVCGSNTGANEALMEPIERGLGETHHGTFDGTTPDKRAATAVAVAQRADDLDADVLVPVGGGSSLDVATVASVVRADGRDTAAVRAEVRETGGIALPDDESALTPLVPVPTTLAGADLSTLAGITVELDDTVVATGVGGTALMPAAVVYDPALFETTPPSVLAGSAMNGFDKAIESLYAANRTPLTDATARRAVAYFDDGLPRLFDEMDDPHTDSGSTDGTDSGSTDGTDSESTDGTDSGSTYGTDSGSTYDSTAVDSVVAGVVLAQYGISRPGETTLNVLHAFGHALRDTFDLQQGVAHAVIAPEALRALFDAGVDSDPLVEAFGVDDSTTVVDRVEAIRDALGLPATLRAATDWDGPADDDAVAAALEEAAAATAADSLRVNAPPAFELTESAARRVLAAAW